MHLKIAGPGEVKSEEEYEEAWELQEKRTWEFLEKLHDKAGEEWRNEEFEILIASDLLDEVAEDEVKDNDENLRLMAIIVTLIYLYKYTESVFLAVAICLAATFSFNPCTLLYVGSAQIRFSYHTNVLIHFVVTIFTAVDTFLIIDTWRQSEQILPAVGPVERKANKVNRMYFLLTYSWSAIFQIQTIPILVYILIYYSI